MANCPDCGNDHSPPSAQTVAWADQFQAEFRDEARGLYSQALADNGITLILDEDTVAKLDTLFAIGGDALVIVLARHDALKRGDW